MWTLKGFCKTNTSDPRHYWIIMGLLYPGILGALIYELGPHLYSGPWTWKLEQWLVLALMVHFALDYAYSVDDKSRREYSWCKFPFDLAIVWLLYAALKAAGEGVTDPSRVMSVCLIMILTRTCAIVWEGTGSNRPDTLARVVAVASDAIPLVGYGVVLLKTRDGSLLPTGSLVGLLVVVALDSMLYWFHEPIYGLFKPEQRDAPAS